MILCSICHEYFDATYKICGLSCGHVYHIDCLRRWIKQDSSCPECRTKGIFEASMIPLYFNFKDLDDSQENQAKQYQISNINHELKKIKNENILLNNKIELLNEKFRNLDELHKNETKKNISLLNKIETLERIKNEYEYSKIELNNLKSKILCFENIEKIINGQESKISEMISQCKDVAQLSSWSIMLKRELEIKKGELKHAADIIKQVKKELAETKENIIELKKENNLSQAHEVIPRDNLITLDDDYSHILSPRLNFNVNKLQKINMLDKMNKVTKNPVPMSNDLQNLSILKKNTLSVPIKSIVKKRKLI